MRLSAKSVLIIASVSVVVGALIWLIVVDRGSEPYTVDARALSGWKVVLGHPEDPWVVAVEPPAALTASLFEQVSKKNGRRLIAPPHTALPLVMRPEHEETLQGVYGIEDINRMASQEIVEASSFAPICIGHRIDTRTSPPAEFFFLAINSTDFTQVRIDVQPDFPEHAGTGIYDPGALTAVLPIATTTTDFDRWWPFRLDQATDCQAQVVIK